MRSPAAPRGSIPVPGEAWEQVGGKAFVAAAWLAPTELVRPLVPDELAIMRVAPGRTLATLFLGDYGPGSTLEYHELGINPALVRMRGLPAVWNAWLAVDSEPARIGGERVGATKELLRFDWDERIDRGRARGACTIADGETALARISYREGLLPVPSAPLPAATLLDRWLLRSVQRIRGGRQRLARVSLEVAPDGPLGWLASIGPPIVGVVVRGLRGRMMDGLRVERVLPDRPHASGAAAVVRGTT